jgi:hypothetical protein
LLLPELKANPLLPIGSQWFSRSVPSSAMPTKAASLTNIQRVFRRYRDRKSVQANATQNAAASKIQAAFRGVEDRKLVRAAKRLARELSAREPMQRALRTHLFRQRLHKPKSSNGSFWRVLDHTRQRSNSLRQRHLSIMERDSQSRSRRCTNCKPQTAPRRYTSSSHTISGPTAHDSFLQVMRSGTRTHALLATTARPVALYVMHSTKVLPLCEVGFVLPMLCCLL